MLHNMILCTIAVLKLGRIPSTELFQHNSWDYMDLAEFERNAVTRIMITFNQWRDDNG